MASTAIAQSLPYVNWVVVFSIAAGCAGAAVVGRLFSEATRGYLTFIAGFALVFGALAFLGDLSLPPAAGLDVTVDPALEGPRRAALALFLLLDLGYLVAIARGGRAALLGSAVLVAAVATAVLAGLAWGGGVPAGVPVGVLFIVLAAAAGGTVAAMVLGHWYLVTPRLPEQPLVGGTRLLIWVLACQLLLFLVWTGVSGGQPFGAFVGEAAVFVWLLLTVGLIFPLVVMVMANRTARTRSMESATGLLYIATAAVLAATIVSAGLYFGSGLLL
ncbi:MAG: hypothetical protein ACXWOT_11675 [Candidatus Limnocylindrales bacterium]